MNSIDGAASRKEFRSETIRRNNWLSSKVAVAPRPTGPFLNCPNAILVLCFFYGSPGVFLARDVIAGWMPRPRNRVLAASIGFRFEENPMSCFVPWNSWRMLVGVSKKIFLKKLQKKEAITGKGRRRAAAAAAAAAAATHASRRGHRRGGVGGRRRRPGRRGASRRRPTGQRRPSEIESSRRPSHTPSVDPSRKNSATTILNNNNNNNNNNNHPCSSVVPGFTAADHCRLFLVVFFSGVRVKKRKPSTAPWSER